MTESLEALKTLLDQCTAEQRIVLLDYLKAHLPRYPLEEAWGVDAEIILGAISRSSDLTKRGVRGIIAEAIFESKVLGGLGGWDAVSFVDDRPYDFLIRSDTPEPREVRIQVKLQRMRKQQPMLASEANRHYPNDMYVVEVQKTRGGIDPKTDENTRPYRFTEFDILAVNMHPSTRDWGMFFYTVSNWLIPRSPNTALIEIFQPVPRLPNEHWTDKLEICLERLSAGQRKMILDIDPKLLERRSRPPKPEPRRKTVQKTKRKPRR
jgi:hypothetical protein